MEGIFTIIVTYNGENYVEKCLTHLLQSHTKTNIIVVDNASTDNTISILQKFEPEISVVRCSENLGFGAGNNVGIKLALEQKATFIFLLNQDAYVTPHCVGKLVHSLLTHNKFGIISPLQLQADGRHLDEPFKAYL